MDNQTFTETTLKGFLLKNVDLETNNPTIIQLNKFLIARVDQFWVDVVLPLRKMGKFDGNKVNWYFEIYKEGVEARKLNNVLFLIMPINESQITSLVLFYKDKTLYEYINLGTSFLANSFAVLSAWTRDQLLYKRLHAIYNDESPVNWIVRAEAEEHGIMSEKECSIEGLDLILKNIGLLMSRRI